MIFLDLQDRRVIKTRSMLRNSLIQLMKERELSSITVKQLCEMSCVNRGTFYLHYKDIFDMINHLEDELFFEFKQLIASHEQLDKDIDIKQNFEYIYTFISQNKDLFTVLLINNGQVSLIKRIVSLIYDKNLAYILKEFNPKDKDLFDKYYSFILYGLIGLIENWLSSGAMESAKFMAAITEQIIFNGLSFKK